MLQYETQLASKSLVQKSSQMGSNPSASQESSCFAALMLTSFATAAQSQMIPRAQLAATHPGSSGTATAHSEPRPPSLGSTTWPRISLGSPPVLIHAILPGLQVSLISSMPGKARLRKRSLDLGGDAYLLGSVMVSARSWLGGSHAIVPAAGGFC